jgi:predicted MFS family arabinose efflux permease
MSVRTAPRPAAPTAPVGRTVVVMTLAGLVVVGQMYAVIPLLPAMAAAWSTTAAAATWTTTAFGLAYAGGFLVSGPLSDRFGRRRVVAVGLVLLTLATGAVAGAPNLPTAVALRVAQGIGAAGFSPAALAYLSERIEPKHRSTAMTYLVTALVAAAVVGQLEAQTVASLVGWRGMFVVSAVVIAALAVALWWVMLPDVPTGGRTVADSFAAMGRLVGRPVMALIYLAALSVLGAFVAVYTALQLLGPSELVDRPGAMLLLRASALPALVAVPLLAPVLGRVRPLPRAAAAMALAAVVLAVLTVATGSVAVIGLLLLVFVGALTAVSPGLTELVGTLSGSARGAGVAVYTFALLIGASLGPQVVTATRAGGLTTVLWVIAGALVAGVALLLTADRLRTGAWFQADTSRHPVRPRSTPPESERRARST